MRLLKFLNEKYWIISFFKIGLMYPIMWETCCILVRKKSSMILGSESIAKFIFKWNPKHNHWKIKLSVRTNSKVLGINFQRSDTFSTSITMSFSIHYFHSAHLFHCVSVYTTFVRFTCTINTYHTAYILKNMKCKCNMY